jgi:hypothetical protein
LGWKGWWGFLFSKVFGMAAVKGWQDCNHLGNQMVQTDLIGFGCNKRFACVGCWAEMVGF